MRSPAGSRAVAALLLALAMAVSACGQEKLDTESAEAAIRDQLTRRSGVSIVSVRCPADVEVRQGDTFRCVATAASGRRSQVEVTQRDGEGNVTWRVVGRP